MRISSRLVPLPEREALTPEDIARMVELLLDEHRRAQYVQKKQADLAYGHPDLGRFRVNIFTQRDEPAIAMRVIPARIRKRP